MALTGELEHLPIVDVIQLLHSTRNSGVLRVRGRRGESQLVFKGGYIVGASHLNNSLRIGELLVGRGLIKQKILDGILDEQTSAGAARRPLIVMLIERGLIKEQDAYAGLKALIEITIVEILTWRKGTFILEASREVAADSFKYYPQEIEREVSVDIQAALMDALRLFDEKMRDGELTLEGEEEEQRQGESEGSAEGDPVDADLLGLSDLERMERQIPDVYLGLPDPAAAAEAVEVRQESLERRFQELTNALPGLERPAEVAAAVLQFAAAVFDRTLTLVVHPGELVAGRGIGIRASGDQGMTTPLGFKIPLGTSSLLKKTIAAGRPFCGPGADQEMAEHLHSRIGPPLHPTILLLPVCRSGRTIFLTYADFGRRPANEVPLQLFEAVAERAGKVLEKRHG